MERLYSSVEITSWEENDLAIARAVDVLKQRLDGAPAVVLKDILRRCDPQMHHDLVDWVSDRIKDKPGRRLPRTWSPKRNRSLWILYAAADLDRPENPPRH